MYDNGEVLSQKLLHPIEVDLNPSDFVLCMEIKEELERLGLEIDQAPYKILMKFLELKFFTQCLPKVEERKET